MDKTYHHGNLKNELIEIGIEMINKDGSKKLSLRKVAAACGVSHNAPYSHFKDRDDYLLAIKKYIEEKFSEALLNAINNSKDENSKLFALAKGYITFFCEHPQYLSFLINENDMEINIGEGEVYTENIDSKEMNSFQIFSKTAERFLTSIGIPKEELGIKIIAKWAMVQGITTLAMMSNIHYVGDKSTDEFIRSLLKELK